MIRCFDDSLLKRNGYQIDLDCNVKRQKPCARRVTDLFWYALRGV